MMHKSFVDARLTDRLERIFFWLLSAALISVIPGCSAPPLKPWHTEMLTAEFAADRADEIRTFEDYRRLEDELFQELDEKVYARVGTGPEYALARYSPGSAADPRGRSPDWNRSFELPVDEPVGGVLLLHGLTDAPYTLRALGKALHKRRYRVLGLRLPGHGTAPSGLTSASWQDMAAAVRLGAGYLASEMEGKPVHIVGYSTGAALALDFALDALEGDTAPIPASLVLISPAIGVHATAALAGLKTGLAALPGLGGLAWLQILPEFDPYKYNSFPTNAGAQVHRLTRSVARRIRERARSSPDMVLPPTLVFKSTVDATVSTDAVVDRLLSQLVPNRHELVLFDVNRLAIKSKLMVSDPAPLTDRLMAEADLPFSITFVTNENPHSSAVLARYKLPFSSEATETERLNLDWPSGVLSLSHVALPIPPDDPLYGRRPPENEDFLFLGEMALQGERGLLRLPADWLLRLRYNPFYDYLEARAVKWVDDAEVQTTHSGLRGDGGG
jgi:alpha-beta hydrolase superfamily lysophospholipase